MAVSLNKQFDEAEEHFETAMRLDPKLYEAPYFYARARKSQGRFGDAARLFERAAALRPEDFQSLGFQAASLESLGMRAESQAIRRKVLRIVENRLELNPEDVRACSLKAIYLAKLGESEGALEFARRSLAIDPNDPMLLYNVASTYSLVGEADEALSCLERAIDRGFGHREWLDNDPDFASIRDLPRFKAIQRAL